MDEQDQAGFLRPPSKDEARSMAEDFLESCRVPASPPVVENGNEANKGAAIKEEDQCGAATEACNRGTRDCPVEGGNELKRKLAGSSDEPSAKTAKISELSAYLSEAPLENGSSLQFWKSAERFPELQAAARKLLSIPATSGGFDRLCPMASCIVKAKRNHLPTHTSERLLLYKNLLKTKTVKKSLAKS